MYDHYLGEMADLLASELHISNHDALIVLRRYWEDKIAPVWGEENVYECAHRSEKPITRDLAVGVLQRAFDKHDDDHPWHKFLGVENTTISRRAIP